METKNIFEMLSDREDSSDEEKRQKEKAKQKKLNDKKENYIKTNSYFYRILILIFNSLLKTKAMQSNIQKKNQLELKQISKKSKRKKLQLSLILLTVKVALVVERK